MSTVTKSLMLSAGTPLLRHHLVSKQFQISLDLLTLIGAFVLAYQLRFDFVLPQAEVPHLFLQLPLVVSIQFSVLMLTGVYKFIWRYVSLIEVKKFALAALWAALPVIVFRLLLPDSWQAWRVPLSVILVDTSLAFAGALGLRVIRRDIYERNHRRATRAGNGKMKPVLLIGAGRAGISTLTEIKSRGDMEIQVKGFIDDDIAKKDSVINGVRVLGSVKELSRFVRELKIDHVVISIAQISRPEYQRILNMCEQVPVKVRTIPGLYEILLGRVQVTRIRDVQIEDLLGRDPVNLDEESMNAFLSSKTVMVTGAGGSIGAELARQVLSFEPARILLVERSECALFAIERELRDLYPLADIVPLVADICDQTRMKAIFKTKRPHVVLHAAAHKHVPMMELNECEAVKNNILGTKLVGELAGECDVETFVLISSDKAVRPTSVMGATKRMAELVIQDLDQKFTTRYVAVRFGNVIGSAGSVLPIFREQICKGGPVTVTHPDMVRYFMTIPEASQLVLQAGAIGKGGEIFILDMGQPVRVFDLAKDMIKLSGFKPFEDIDIVFTGVRPGEKLFEELQVTGEEVTKTGHPKILIGRITKYPSEQLLSALDQLRHLACEGMSQEARETLNSFLTEASLSVGNSAGREDSSLLLSGAGTPPLEALVMSGSANYGLVEQLRP